MKISFLFLAALLLLCNTPSLSQEWKPTAYEVSFKIKNAGLTVTGRFSGLQSHFIFNPQNLQASALRASVEVATINTGIDMRDRDLQGGKYFDAAKYKTIQVATTKIYPKGNGYAAMCNVTIKGVTKQMEIPFTFTQTGANAEIAGSFPLKRSDFGIGGKPLTMSDDLVVHVHITLNK